MNIGLYFGTYNPIHNGHIYICKEILKSKKVDSIWLVVTPQSPFKERINILDENIRLYMVDEAIKNLKNIISSSIEFELSKPNYTIKTLNFLNSKDLKNNYKIILGEDNLESFDSWKDSSFIKNNYDLIIYPRSNNIDSNKLFDGKKINISSTEIRKKIRNNKSIKDYVPQVIEDIIKKNNYYS